MNQITNINEEAVTQEELDAAMQDDTTVFTHEFIKPILYNGKQYKELHFDFDKLTGRDCLNISEELTAIGKAAIVPALSEEYLIRFAARACTEDMVGSDVFDVMKSRDYHRIISRTRSFLLRAD